MSVFFCIYEHSLKNVINLNCFDAPQCWLQMQTSQFDWVSWAAAMILELHKVITMILLIIQKS